MSGQKSRNFALAGWRKTFEVTLLKFVNFGKSLIAHEIRIRFYFVLSSRLVPNYFASAAFLGGGRVNASSVRHPTFFGRLPS